MSVMVVGLFDCADNMLSLSFIFFFDVLADSLDTTKQQQGITHKIFRHTKASTCPTDLYQVVSAVMQTSLS